MAACVMAACVMAACVMAALVAAIHVFAGAPPAGRAEAPACKLAVIMHRI